MSQTEYEAAFKAGAATKLTMLDIQGIPAALVPDGATLKTFEKLLDAPKRIQETPCFTDIAGFSDYIEEFKVAGSRIFINEEERRFTTIFDCHHKDSPAWGDHSASLKIEFSREWLRFVNVNEQKQTALDFAEFIEDNVAYITGPMVGLDLLAMAQSMKIKIKGDFEVEESLHSGMKKLLIADDSVVSGRDSTKKEMSFPEKIQLNLRIFKNSFHYPIEVFLRMRKTDKGIIFWIKIPDVEAIQEEAFDQIINEVKKETKLPTLKGSFEGPSHRRR